MRIPFLGNSCFLSLPHFFLLFFADVRCDEPTSTLLLFFHCHSSLTDSHSLKSPLLTPLVSIPSIVHCFFSFRFDLSLLPAFLFFFFGAFLPSVLHLHFPSTVPPACLPHTWHLLVIPLRRLLYSVWFLSISPCMIFDHSLSALSTVVFLSSGLSLLEVHIHLTSISFFLTAFFFSPSLF